jgi:hypothetical protein
MKEAYITDKQNNFIQCTKKENTSFQGSFKAGVLNLHPTDVFFVAHAQFCNIIPLCTMKNKFSA